MFAEQNGTSRRSYCELVLGGKGPPLPAPAAHLQIIAFTQVPQTPKPAMKATQTRAQGEDFVPPTRGLSPLWCSAEANRMFCTELAASCPHPLPPGPYLVLNNSLRTQQNQEQGQSKNFLTLLVRDDTGVFLCALEKARPGKVLCRFSLLSHLRAVGGTEGDIPLGSAGSCHVLTPWVEQRSSPLGAPNQWRVRSLLLWGSRKGSLQPFSSRGIQCSEDRRDCLSLCWCFGEHN